MSWNKNAKNKVQSRRRRKRRRKNKRNKRRRNQKPKIKNNNRVKMSLMDPGNLKHPVKKIGGMTRSKKRDGKIQRVTKNLFSMVILSITEDSKISKILIICNEAIIISKQEIIKIGIGDLIEKEILLFILS